LDAIGDAIGMIASKRIETISNSGPEFALRGVFNGAKVKIENLFLKF
jgi:hypothetical protein